MNDPKYKPPPSEKASLEYYMSSLEESRDQKNVDSSLFFIHKILEIHGSKVSVNQVTSYIIVFFVIVNFIIAISNTYVLLLK